MKISILKESLCLGGTERSAANISLLLAQNHEVEFVLYDGGEISYSFGGKLVDLKLPAQRTRLSRIFNNVKRAIKYTKCVREFNPDIIYQFISNNNPIGMIPYRNSVKIVSCRDFGALKKDLRKFKIRLNVSDAMVCNSQYMKDFYLSYYPEDENKVFTINNIVDIEGIREKACECVDVDFEIFRNAHNHLIVSVGRFCDEKAFDCLIEAFANVRKKKNDVGLVLVGDGKLKDDYLRLVDKYKLNPNVFFTGFQNNPYKFISKCDVFVLSSYSEGFPNVLVEAMSLSLPVISINCFSGPAEILTSNCDYQKSQDGFEECEYGILVPHYDVQGREFTISELSKAIELLLLEEDLLKYFGSVAAKRSEQYTAKSISDKFDDLIDSLL